jgi:hypothetical protein
MEINPTLSARVPLVSDWAPGPTPGVCLLFSREPNALTYCPVMLGRWHTGPVPHVIDQAVRQPNPAPFAGRRASAPWRFVLGQAPPSAPLRPPNYGFERIGSPTRPWRSIILSPLTSRLATTSPHRIPVPDPAMAGSVAPQAWWCSASCSVSLSLLLLPYSLISSVLQHIFIYLFFWLKHFNETNCNRDIALECK